MVLDKRINAFRPDLAAAKLKGVVEAPRFGLVGKDQTIAVRVLDTADRGEPIELVVRRDGAEISRTRARAGTLVRVNVRVEHGGPNVIEL